MGMCDTCGAADFVDATVSIAKSQTATPGATAPAEADLVKSLCPMVTYMGCLERNPAQCSEMTAEVIQLKKQMENPASPAPVKFPSASQCPTGGGSSAAVTIAGVVAAIGFALV